MSDANTAAIQQLGRLEYQRARQHGQLNQVLGLLTGRPRHPRGLSGGASGRYAGVQTVPVRRIVGSEGRGQVFDASFNPLNDEMQGRWVSVYSAWKRGKSLPPVDLIWVGEAYYVRDGHHRVSVARIMGQEYIEATVTEWD